MMDVAEVLRLRIGDVVVWRGSLPKKVGVVDRFDGEKVIVSGTGPYAPDDWERYVPARTLVAGQPGAPALKEPDADGHTCHCRTFSECTHK